MRSQTFRPYIHIYIYITTKITAVPNGWLVGWLVEWLVEWLVVFQGISTPTDHSKTNPVYTYIVEYLVTRHIVVPGYINKEVKQMSGREY